LFINCKVVKIVNKKFIICFSATTSEAPSPTATTEPTRLQTTLQPTTVEIEQMTTNTISPIDSKSGFVSMQNKTVLLNTNLT
jgi:hypothetical protein